MNTDYNREIGIALGNCTMQVRKLICEFVFKSVSLAKNPHCAIEEIKKIELHNSKTVFGNSTIDEFVMKTSIETLEEISMAIEKATRK